MLSTMLQRTKNMRVLAAAGVAMALGLPAVAQGQGRVFWEFFEINTQGGATSVNDSGQVVGWKKVTGGIGVGKAFIWSEGGGLRDLDGNNAFAQDINNDGDVVGYREDATTGRYEAVWWENGNNLRTLPGLTQEVGRESRAMGINNSGHIVGWGETAEAGIHAISWVDPRASARDLTEPSNNTFFGKARAVSNSGTIVGSSYFPSEENHHAVRWASGQLNPVDLGASSSGFSELYDADDSGRGVGFMDSGSGRRPMIYLRNAEFGKQPGLNLIDTKEGIANAMSDAPSPSSGIWVVGTFYDGSSPEAFVWEGGSFPETLTSIISNNDLPTEWEPAEAHGVASNGSVGYIVGMAFDGSTRRPFMLKHDVSIVP